MVFMLKLGDVYKEKPGCPIYHNARDIDSGISSVLVTKYRYLQSSFPRVPHAPSWILPKSLFSQTSTERSAVGVA